MRKHFLTILFFILFIDLFAQDPIISQFYYNGILLNPALTGSNHGGTRFNLNHRGQWARVPGVMTSSSFSFDSKFHNTASFGGYFCNDMEGEHFLTTNSFGIMGAYNGSLSKNIALNAGLGYGLLQKRIDWDAFTFYDQLDPILGQIYESSVTVPNNFTTRLLSDFSFGTTLMIRPKRRRSLQMVMIGFSAFHINEPRESFYYNESIRMPVKYTFHGGAYFVQNKGYEIVYYPFYRFMSQENINVIDFGLNTHIKTLLLGAGFRSILINKNNANEASYIESINHLILLFGLSGKQTPVQLSYSVDVSLTGTPISTGFTHEIGLSFIVNNSKLFSFSKYNKRRWQPNECADFYKDFNIIPNF
jgi:type IX secretion system PorP/SprF family membrane protein